MKQGRLKIYSICLLSILFLISFAPVVFAIECTCTPVTGTGKVSITCSNNCSNCGSQYTDCSKKEESLSCMDSCLMEFDQATCAKQCGSTSSSSNDSDSSANTTELKNPLGTLVDPRDIVGNIINAALGLVGSLALLMFIYGGFLWVTSAGNDEKIKKGRDIIMWSALGLALIFASYALLNFILNAITTSTGTGSKTMNSTGAPSQQSTGAPSQSSTGASSQ